MIEINGYRYGRATEIAAQLGADITAQRVRDWARRGLLPRHRVRGSAYYRLDQAAAAERKTRRSTRGRRRSLDTGAGQG